VLTPFLFLPLQNYPLAGALFVSASHTPPFKEPFICLLFGLFLDGFRHPFHGVFFFVFLFCRTLVTDRPSSSASETSFPLEIWNLSFHFPPFLLFQLDRDQSLASRTPPPLTYQPSPRGSLFFFPPSGTIFLFVAEKSVWFCFEVQTQFCSSVAPLPPTTRTSYLWGFSPHMRGFCCVM